MSRDQDTLPAGWGGFLAVVASFLSVRAGPGEVLLEQVGMMALGVPCSSECMGKNNPAFLGSQEKEGKM